MAAQNERVYNFVGREMLRGGIAALAHPIFTASETLQLIRDILAQQLASSPGPKQVSQHVSTRFGKIVTTATAFCRHISGIIAPTAVQQQQAL